MAALNGKIEALSPQQLQALADRLLARRPRSADEDQIPQRPARLPLSFPQEGLWLLDRLGLGGAAYNQCFSMRLTGALSRDALSRGLADVVRRHEVLRTRIVVVGDEPCQVVDPPGEVDLLCVDFSHCSEAERECQMRKHIEAQASEPFDLDRCLHRASLMKMSEREHILCWVVHHMVWDAWSMWLFLGELTAHYAAHARGVPLNRPPLVFQYADYALRQRRRLPTAAADLLAYWRKQLDGAPPTLDLPTDRPYHSHANLKGGVRLSMSLDKALTDGLERLARQESVTLYMLTLAAFKAALFRWSGVGDLTVGTAVGGRAGRAAESLIGYFSNVLVMRTRLSGELTFQDLLRKVKATATDAFAHQDLPFGTLVSQLAPPRSLGRNPLFQVSFMLQDFHASVRQEVTGELQLSLLDFAEWKPRFELELQLAKMPDGMAVWFSYQTALFDRSTIERWMAHYQTILRAIVHDPYVRIANIPMLGEAERARLLEEFRAPCVSAPGFAHELFEEHVRATPAVAALVCDGRTWSFAELNSQANRLAHCLIARDVGPGVPVGLLSSGVSDFVIGLLAVLKAGGTCVLLRPGDSSAALADALKRAGARIAVTSGCADWPAPGSGIDVVRMDGEVRVFATMPDTNPAQRGLAGHHGAYVTSSVDSAGERNYVTIAHSGVATLLEWMRTEFPHDRFPQMALSVRPGLDASLVDVLGALASGVTVHAFASPLNANASVLDVPLVCATPAALEQLVDSGQLGARVEALRVRGGPPSPRLVEKIFSTTHVKRVTCLFGFPETTCVSTYLHIDGLAEVERKIGRPLPGASVYILDSSLQLVPIGVYGDLYIGGAGLGGGYLRQPAATSRVFAQNPFDPLAGSRIFRTGRRARWLDDGSIELEDLRHTPLPSERRVRALEEELAKCTQIRESAVVAAGEREQRLIAYVVPDAGQLALSRERARARWEAEHVAAWRERGKEIYGSASAAVQPGFDATGWINNFTKLPFNAMELRESIDETVQRIRTLQPRRVLEVGCGTGLLLYGLAPGCVSYVATDVSPEALQRAQSQLAEVDVGCPVELYELPAHEIDVLPSAPCDTVILDSVVQCFPSVEYLLDVLSSAVGRVIPGGNIFLGNLRNVSLQAAFHAAAELQLSADSMSVADYRARLRERMAAERELAVSPELFTRLARKDARIGDVQIHLRRGCHDTELTQFHYDVILRVGEKTPRVEPVLLDGAEEALTRRLVDVIRTRKPAQVIARAVPNARLAKPLALLRLLEEPLSDVYQVGDLRQRLEDEAGHGVDPELLWNMGEQLHYDTQLDWSAGRADGSFDAVFSRPDSM